MLARSRPSLPLASLDTKKGRGIKERGGTIPRIEERRRRRRTRKGRRGFAIQSTCSTYPPSPVQSSPVHPSPTHLSPRPVQSHCAIELQTFRLSFLLLHLPRTCGKQAVIDLSFSLVASPALAHCLSHTWRS